MSELENQLERWVGANVIDALTANRILAFEKQSGKGGLRWPAILAIGFGTLMLCAGILLFVAAHWDEISPMQRFASVLALVAVFHLAAGILGAEVPNIGMALHLAGTVCLGGGIFLAAQIFNLEEHWPGGIMLWALGAVLAWLVLRQWPQAAAAAVLIPFWLGGEWSLATENYRGAPWNIAAQGFLLLAILYISTPQKPSNRYLRRALLWVGAIALIPFLGDVMFSGGNRYYWDWQRGSLPSHLAAMGYLLAYVPALAIAAVARKRESFPILCAALWVFVLGTISRHSDVDKNAWIYLWVAVGACAFCYWGVHDNRRLFINYGTAIFALNVIAFYFSEVLDKMGRSMGLILLGVIFLAGGWVLNRLRTDLIARAAAAGGAQ